MWCLRQQIEMTSAWALHQRATALPSMAFIQLLSPQSPTPQVFQGRHRRPATPPLRSPSELPTQSWAVSDGEHGSALWGPWLWPNHYKCWDWGDPRPQIHQPLENERSRGKRTKGKDLVTSSGPRAACHPPVSLRSRPGRTRKTGSISPTTQPLCREKICGFLRKTFLCCPRGEYHSSAYPEAPQSRPGCLGVS